MLESKKASGWENTNTWVIVQEFIWLIVQQDFKPRFVYNQICLLCWDSLLPLLLRIPFLFLSSPLLLEFLLIPRHQVQTHYWSQKLTWSHHFSELLTSFTCTCTLFLSFLHSPNMYWSPALCQQCWRLWTHCGEHGAASLPGHLSSTHYAVWDFCIILAHALLLSPCPDSKLLWAKAISFIYSHVSPSLPSLLQ